MRSRQNQYMITGSPVSFGRTSPGSMLGIICLLFFLLTGNKVQAQTQATGHVFAEVIEPTTLTADANNHHVISEPDNLTNELLLAEVKLSGGDVNIDVSVQTANLKSKDGEILLFDAFACPECTAEDPDSSGEKLFTLIGTPGSTKKDNMSNQFNGQYRVTFMYN